jgi:hypothetical protein
MATQRFSKRKKHVLIGLIALVFLAVAYIGVYARLSARGEWKLAIAGGDGREWYEWAPRGFIRNGQWDDTMMTVFSPVYFIDRRVWHNKAAFAKARANGDVDGLWRGDFKPL